MRRGEGEERPLDEIGLFRGIRDSFKKFGGERRKSLLLVFEDQSIYESLRFHMLALSRSFFESVPL